MQEIGGKGHGYELITEYHTSFGKRDNVLLFDCSQVACLYFFTCTAVPMAS
jgi:hypothetical protein